MFRNLLLATITSLLVTGSHARTWTSADGAKTFEGELLSYDPATGAVGVTLTSGKAMRFSQDKLSEADIAFLKEQGKFPADKAAAKPCCQGASRCVAGSRWQRSRYEQAGAGVHPDGSIQHAGLRESRST